MTATLVAVCTIGSVANPGTAAADSVIATIPAGGGPVGVAINRAGTYGYVTNDLYGTVDVINLSAGTVTATIPVTSNPDQEDVNPAGVAVNPSGTDAYITNFNDGSVAVLALTLTAPGRPGGPIAVDGDHQATVSVTAPTTGGTPTSYKVTAADSTTPDHGGQTCTVDGATGSCTVTGLTNGDTYTFTATATNPAGTSAASPASNPVIPALPADLALTITVPPSAVDGSSFTETVSIDNNGPGLATNLDTEIFVPAGLTVTAAFGATVYPNTLDYSFRAVGAGYAIIYSVTFKVDAGAHAIASMGAVVEDDGYDPYLFNNVGIAAIQLLPSNP